MGTSATRPISLPGSRAAFRASGMLSLRALGAVDHAAGARVLAVGQFDVGVVAVVQRGPSLWDLVVGGVVQRFEDAAGALAAQGLSALWGPPWRPPSAPCSPTSASISARTS